MVLREQLRGRVGRRRIHIKKPGRSNPCWLFFLEQHCTGLLLRKSNFLSLNPTHRNLKIRHCHCDHPHNG
jgi:hypothetical protein